MKIGIGYDSHKLVNGRRLVIGGVEIHHKKGLAGHSDADVLIHAIIDALFGAAGLVDIGSHFPNTDERFKDIDSRLLLRQAVKLVSDKGYRIGNIDAVIIAEEPKMAPYIDKMRKNIAEDMGIEVDRISIKAKTNEGMGFVGRGEAIASQAVALLEK